MAAVAAVAPPADPDDVATRIDEDGYFIAARSSSSGSEKNRFS
jgi:hypothetical protein